MREEVLSDSVRIICGDCRDVLPTLADGAIDAVVTDPPYGIDYENAGGRSAKNGWKEFDKLGWERPPQAAFEEIRRVSGQQIVWGGNYFTDYLPPTMQWLVWDKGQRNFTLADCEFAWSSQWRGARIFTYSRGEANQEPRVHPTQKPVSLMLWCIQQLRPAPKSVGDFFMGAGSTGVAAIKLGCSFIGCEREPAYFDVACRRLSAVLSEPSLFAEPKARAEQASLFGDQ